MNRRVLTKAKWNFKNSIGWFNKLIYATCLVNLTIYASFKIHYKISGTSHWFNLHIWLGFMLLFQFFATFMKCSKLILMEKQNFYKESQELFLMKQFLLIYFFLLHTLKFLYLNNENFALSNLTREIPLQIYATFTSNLWHPGCWDARVLKLCERSHYCYKGQLL